MRDDEKKKLYENLKQEIRSLLISSPKTKYGGLSGSLLYFDYKQLNCGKEIPYAELGFHSFLSLLRSMPDVVRIESKENSSSYRVHPVYDQSTAHIQKMVLEQRDKYEHENRLSYQNWYSNREFTMNNTHKNVQTNFHVLQKNNSSKKFYQEKFLISNKYQTETNSEPYLLLTQITLNDNEKINNDNFNFLSCLSSKLNNYNNNQTSSTPKTFLETPSNLSFEDDSVNELIKKNLNEKNILYSSTNNQIKDNSLLVTTINFIPNDQLFISSKDNQNILSTIIDEKSSLENENLLKRINNAIRQCINFRYQHRLCEIQFKYRHYPITNDIILIKSKFEQIAFNQYEKELEDFEKFQESNSNIDDQICQMMFDQYISLKRNYYYMSKLINKTIN